MKSEKLKTIMEIIWLMTLIIILVVIGYLFGYKKGVTDFSDLEGPKTLATYELKYNYLIVYGNKIETIEKARLSFLHEYGHFIWYQKLDIKTKNTYCEEYFDINNSVSIYAQTNCEEDFAEEFKYYGDYFLVSSRDEARMINGPKGEFIWEAVQLTSQYNQEIDFQYINEVKE